MNDIISQDYEIKDLGWEEILRKTQKMARLEIAVGLQEGSKTTKGGDLPLVGARNEYGSKGSGLPGSESETGTPARPFMKKTASSKKNEAFKILEDGADRILRHNAPINHTLHIIGKKYGGWIKKTITAWKIPPNSAKTIKIKGRNDPLVNKGRMRSSIIPKVRRRRK